MFKEFKSFITRGNIIDLAIGVIIGGAFQKIVNSLVNDIIMPAISILTGKVDYSALGVTIGGATLKYGSFLTTIINFLIIALSIFVAIKVITKVNKKMEIATQKQLEKLAKNEALEKISKLRKKKNKKDETEPTTKICPFCYSEVNIKATRCSHCTSELTETK